MRGKTETFYVEKYKKNAVKWRGLHSHLQRKTLSKSSPCPQYFFSYTLPPLSLNTDPNCSFSLPLGKPTITTVDQPQHHLGTHFVFPINPSSSAIFSGEENRAAPTTAIQTRPFRRQFRPPQATISDDTTTKRTTSESSTQRC